MMPIKVLIADDQSMVCSCLRMELSQQSDIQIVGEALRVDDILPKIKASTPDILLIDHNMQSGIEMGFLRKILKGKKPPAVFIFCASIQADEFSNLLKAGVRGILGKTAGAGEIVEGIRVLAKGSTWVSRDIIGLLAKKGDKSPANEGEKGQSIGFSPRQDQVLRLVTKGYNNKQIANELGLKERTIRYHLEFIMSKLGANNRVELVLHALKQGLIALEVEQ
jgi:DNA-binding NarL/FixJ family response regulator